MLTEHARLSGYLAAAATTFLACMQYWTWQEALQPGRQFADPLLPCLLLTVLITPLVVLAVTAPVLTWRYLRLRRLCRAYYVVRAQAQAQAQAACALPMLVAEHRDAPGRIVWKPDGGTFDAADLPRVAELAFDHDVTAILVAMNPATEQAARILLADAWSQLCQRRRVRKPCPVILPLHAPARQPRPAPRPPAAATPATVAVPATRARHRHPEGRSA